MQKLSPAEEKIKSSLQRGDKTQIAKKLNIHLNTVWGALDGRWKNTKVWIEALSIIEARQKLEKKKERIAQSLNQ